MADHDEDRIARLEQRISQLEHQVFQLKYLVDPERDPFTYLCFESNLTEQQERQIYDLMDETEKRIRAGTAMIHHDFEQRIYAIVPKHDGSYSFAETIVSVLNQAGRWGEVFTYMQEHGMNLGTPSPVPRPRPKLFV